MEHSDIFFASPGVLRGRAYTRAEFALTAATQAERYEHQRMLALYEKAIEDAVARQAVIAHDQRTRVVFTETVLPVLREIAHLRPELETRTVTELKARTYA
jgi:hypothetical protein